MMHPALRLTRHIRIRPAVPLTALAVTLVAITAAWLPSIGGHSAAAWGSVDQLALLRIALLAVAYSLAAIAAYRCAPSGGASSAAVLWGGALGWGGWGLDNALLGSVVFAALVLLIDQLSARTERLAATLVIGWALVDPHAVWGALLVLLYALQRWRDRPIALFGSGSIALATAWARGFDPWTVLFPTARPWVWADGQAANKFGDPLGLALFGGMLLLVALARFRRGQTRLYLLPLAVFALLAWQARRNGLWLGLAAVPTIAALLSDLDLPFRRWASPAVAFASIGLLGLAILSGPNLLTGPALSSHIVRAIHGPVMYRPTFEQALREEIVPVNLLLAASDDPKATYTAWTRIATNCAPADELERLGANAVVLDTTLDRLPISTLAADPRWRQAAADQTATVFVRVDGQS
jgi:hypothetical protein